MIQEAVQHSALNHPNIIKLYDYFIQENKISLVLEYAQHGNLFKLMRKQRQNEQQIHKYFTQTANALMYIHTQKLIHRDLKPENLLLDSNFNIKVCDFGWSGLKQSGQSRFTFCGTLDYMSPEVIRGDNQSYEVDIWALGILLYELFHDVAPFKGNTHTELLNNIVEKKPKISPMVPKEAKDLILRLLAIEPSKRINLQEIKTHPFVLKYPCEFTELSQDETENEKMENASTTVMTEKSKDGTKKDDMSENGGPHGGANTTGR